ncbi:MAG: hypothetical protein PHP46_03335, partial [Candidatus Omnitrophica bacterium]|nr:hypothetical protein [Candidatus Omnitrophota bacterium]
MMKKTVKLVSLALVVAMAIMISSAAFAGEIKGKVNAIGMMEPKYTVTQWGPYERLTNPTTALIPETPSIKQMVSQPAPKLSYVR